MKHLEFIQAVITRMATNSFTYKGWAITLVSGILALSKDIPPVALVLVGTAMVVLFWGLDAYYLRQERLYRCLWSESVDEKSTLFSMNASIYKKEVQGWWRTLLTSTILSLYLPLLSLVVGFGYYKSTLPPAS